MSSSPAGPGPEGAASDWTLKASDLVRSVAGGMLFGIDCDAAAEVTAAVRVLGLSFDAA